MRHQLVLPLLRAGVKRPLFGRAATFSTAPPSVALQQSLLGSPATPAPPPATSPSATILALNQALLDTIMRQDWEGYASMCDPSLTCIEAEARGCVAVGIPFHKIYYPPSAPAPPPRRVATMASPHVRMLGANAAVLCYVRLVQSVSESGEHATARVEETRVWARKGSKAPWLLVHFHKGCA